MTPAGADRRRFLASAAAVGVRGVPAETAARAETASRCESDVLVCGGGPSGMAAAANAARQGARVILLERWGRLGGMAVSGLVGPLMGGVKSPLVEEVMRRTSAPKVDPNLLDIEHAEIVREAGVRILLHTWVTGVRMDGSRILLVQAISKPGGTEFQAGVFVDASGDGDVAFRAGADWEMGRKGGGREAVRLMAGGRSWRDIGREANRNGEIPPDAGIVRTDATDRPGEVIVNAARSNGVSGISAEDLTRAELDGRRPAGRILKFLRRRAPGYEKARISLMPAAVGVRETRRIVGEKHLQREHLVAGRRWDDAVVWDARFPIDIHNPAGVGQAGGRFAEEVKPYQSPYGRLVPKKKIGNLLTAGRCISGSHEAHASYRVQKIAMAIGAAAGAAAGVAARKGRDLREIDAAAVQRFLLRDS